MDTKASWRTGCEAECARPYLFSGPAVAQASRLRKWRQASRLLVNGPSGNRDGCGTIASEDACATALNRYWNASLP